MTTAPSGLVAGVVMSAGAPTNARPFSSAAAVERRVTTETNANAVGVTMSAAGKRVRHPARRLCIPALPPIGSPESEVEERRRVGAGPEEVGSGACMEALAIAGSQGVKTSPSGDAGWFGPRCSGPVIAPLPGTGGYGEPDTWRCAPASWLVGVAGAGWP